METSDRLLLWVLLLAMAAFPVAVCFYLRTAYRKGGWREVKTAAILAGFAMLIPVGLKIWYDWEIRHVQRVIEHPFAWGSILLVALMWLAHRALKAWTGETHDHY
jgi:RsiW-degrading membrane proteinase PrsW (M82 family)